METKVDNWLESCGRKLLAGMGDVREQEYKQALRYLEGCEKILDVGCGTGTFLAKVGNRGVGIDINPENIAYCIDNNLNAQVGSALDIPFPDNSFDAVLSSHLMQVFPAGDAAQFMKEILRVVKPGGVVVIITLNWFPDFWKHPENARPYPPIALRAYGCTQSGATSPMWPGIPPVQQEDIWYRHKPLIQFQCLSNLTLSRLSLFLNRLQCFLGIQKFWTFDAYAVKLRCLKS